MMIDKMIYIQIDANKSFCTRKNSYMYKLPYNIIFATKIHFSSFIINSITIKYDSSVLNSVSCCLISLRSGSH